ncbi:hypothetical protein ACJX0J_033719, partial [Zea mays]
EGEREGDVMFDILPLELSARCSLCNALSPYVLCLVSCARELNASRAGDFVVAVDSDFAIATVATLLSSIKFMQ